MKPLEEIAVYITTSARRLREAVGLMEEQGEEKWLWFVRKETKILLRRVLRIWLVTWLMSRRGSWSSRFLGFLEIIPLKVCPKLWGRFLAKLGLI